MLTPKQKAKTLPLGLLLLLAMLGSQAPAAAPMQQAFLIQNSGWMEPFYTDPRSQFKPLVLAVFHAVTSPDEKVFVSVFNQSFGDHQSPELIFSSGAAGPPLEDVIAAVTVAKKPKSGALTDTDFQEAVTKTIVEQFLGRPGIIWIFTNNRNSPHNDPETLARNREFYELVHIEPTIARTVVFPLGMAVKGRVYQAGGLMVYALAYGQEADAALRHLIQSGRTAKVFTEQPARLKPLDRDSVRLLPREIRNESAITVGMAADQATVLLDVVASREQPRVEIVASLENLFYPYIIEAADIAARFTVGSWQGPLSVDPPAVSRLQPGAQEVVRVSLPIPLAQIPSIWSAKAMSSLGKRIQMEGTVEITLNNQRLALSDTFRQDLNALFPGDPISEVFVPPQDTLASRVSIPLLIRINYPLYPLIIIGAALLLGLGLILFALGFFTRPRDYHIRVDGQVQTCRLKPFQRQELYCAAGDRVAGVRRGLTGVEILDPKEGHRVEVTQ
ncbi:hypothetical protein [Candidatus Thiodictyon syntrophicum]|uniref:VWA domain-containing protein n=1 Tax=Candidatus Thiodictyon syntrophicum TaxID=1166950 RepID=A0A2K8U4B7_9GAMM|nr:hypothetical protein [Candidatus Thiodictyon syntrophicum]AUB80397.1 hypothetical protein THSYN_05150 [Candidatus Thiodictyon syntrophicum]